jgi:Ca2+-binding RTX toxin-like protein
MALVPNTLTAITAAERTSVITSTLGAGLPPGVTITNVTYTGADTAISQFVNLDLGSGYTMGGGLLLTSGQGLANRTNTSGSFSDIAGTVGDAELDAVAKSAFEFAGETKDAAFITVTFNVTDPNVKTIKLKLALGTDEFPEFKDTSYVDVAAVLKDGKNFALFNGNAKQPFSVIGANVDLGVFIDNASGQLAIEYDGVSKIQNVFIPVTQGQNTIKIAVADTGDSIYDTGLFVLDAQASNSSFDGFFNDVAGTDLADTLVGTSANDIMTGGGGKDKIDGLLGDDVLNGGAGTDELKGGKGADTFLFEFLGKDKVLDFSKKQGDKVALEDSFFTAFGANGFQKGELFFGKKAKGGNDYLVYDKKTGKLYYDADGSGSGKQKQIADFKDGLNLKFSDFELF